VVDAGRDLLIKYSADGDSVAAVGGYGTGSESFDRPVSVWARTGTDILVADYNNHRVQRFDRRLDYVNTLQTRSGADDRSQFGYPLDAALSRQGETFVLDSENRRIVEFDASNEFVRSFGDVASGKGFLQNPSMIELDAHDNVYVLEPGRIVIFDPFGSWINDLELGPQSAVSAISLSVDTLSLISPHQVVRMRVSPAGRVMERVDTIELNGATAASGGRVGGGSLMIVDTNRVHVRKFPVQGSDTLQKR
jgi:hypothetical protein